VKNETPQTRRPCKTGDFLPSQARRTFHAESGAVWYVENDADTQKAARPENRQQGLKNSPRTGKGCRMKRSSVTSSKSARFATTPMAMALGLLLLAGCEEGEGMSFLQPKEKPAETGSQSGTEAGQTTKLVERDVEVPEVFQVTEAGLWDGRPSLGGVWVAHPDVTDPERVIIRNTSNNKFVIGALFRREREIPGPRVQASSDAAAALGMLAGSPVQLNVTALRRETVEEKPEPTEQAAAPVDDEEITETTLDPIAGAAAAIAASEPATETATETAAAKPAPVVAAPTPAPAKPKGSSLSKPYIQIGIFSVEKNADHTANQMRSAGMIPTVFEQTANSKPFWRVVVGPAQSKSERSALLNKVKKAGFTDAYAVTN